ncbi:LamG-like jellyroll fold domain-containing protein [Aeromonas rivipollensis]|uniref:LamG-like jellyroll fold domain-containing protein n=2 Tax=Aeromonas rivipollensis TaxID=948519 RepID=UPI003D226AF4
MATLSDTIKGTSGLLAYWPLTDHTDQSGNGRHLTAVGAPGYGQAPMTSDGHTSIKTPDSGATLRIDQSTLPKIRAVEGVFRLAGAKGTDYSAVFGLNQPTAGFNYRYVLLYGNSVGVCSYQSISPAGGNTFYKSLVHSWEELAYNPHHFVVQLNAAGTVTEVYIDGVKDTAMQVPFDVFMQTAGLYLTVGAFYYNGAIGAGGGNGQISDMAIYDRPLTQTEITARLDFLLGPPELKAVPMATTWGNQETREQANPSFGPLGQPIYPALPTAPQLVAYDGLMMITQDGRSRGMGYIESTVTIDGEGVRRRVLCLTQSGDLVAETMSRAGDGKYRFDNLWLNRRYMLVAQDDPAFGPADYNAVAADYQLPTPYAPGEGVGLV